MEASVGLTLAIEGALHPGETVRLGRIEAVPDRPPAVAWEGVEGSEITVPAGWPVELAARASDDVAVEAMELWIDGAASSALARAEVEGLHTTSARARWSVDPAALGIRPGGRFTCVVIARDGRPPTGQSSTSIPMAVRVVTDEQYKAMAQERLDPARVAEDRRRVDRALARLAARQADLAARAAAGESGDAPGPAELARHAAEARSLAARLTRMARPPHLDAPDAELATALGRASEALDQAGDASDALAAATAAMLEAGSRGAGSGARLDAGMLQRFRAGAEALEAARQTVAERARAALASRSGSSSGTGAGSAGGRGAAGGLQGPHTPTPWDADDSASGGEQESDASASHGLATTRLERSGKSSDGAANGTADGTARGAVAPSALSTSLTGLPPELQDLARAYFRRLNETGRPTGDRPGK